MDQISNVNNVGFAANQPVKVPETSTVSAHAVQIENGDEKSMDALKWAGIIGAGALAAAGITTAIIKGKGIDAKHVDMAKLAKDGVAELTEEGKKAFEKKKITKFIYGIGKDGSIKKAKIVSDDASKLQTFIKNGKRISQKTTVDGKKVKLWYDSNNKLAKTVKDGVTTTFEYGTEGATKGKLIKKSVGKAVQEFAYTPDGKISQIKSGDKVLQEFIWDGPVVKGVKKNDKLVSIKTPETIQKFNTNKGKLVSKEVTDLKGKTLSKYYVNRGNNGEVLSTITATYGDDAKLIYRTGDNVLTKQSKLIDKQMHTTVAYGDNKAVQVLGEDYKPIKIIFNDKELSPEGKNIYQLVGITPEQYNKFMTDVSIAGV